ncbi:MFS general substrate transporter [Decorospora gaudefroyi]|uniref:MFS general substrate transporter n=1 Tax=Decorospora gaudefroyi TaxID=184978 RepID=A0A6A5KNG5_9PLEO|nr:MFS general substrate transporter [Decorospora gaudefroyi]
MPHFLTGWRLHLTTLGLCLAVFLVNIEVTIVSTSGLAIANDFHGVHKLGWILTGYLITYTGFIIPWAKSSDIFGRKSCILASLVIFAIFSGACGAAQTINQLIIFRVLQGIGAAGGWALAFLFVYGMVPPDKYPLYGSLMAADVSIANLAGPLVGGALSQPKTWRWVFLLNVPAGLVTVVVLAIAIPNGFPFHKNYSAKNMVNRTTGYFLSKVKRLDLVGATLLLAAALLLSTGLLEGGIQWEWNSAPSIALLTISGLLWIAFFWWERLVTMKEEWPQEPMFPWRFIHNRQWMGVLLSSLLNGLPFYIFVISIPQRFETVNGLTPIQTGIKLLPYTLVAAFGAVFANGIAATGKIAPIYIMFFFSALGTVGAGCMTTIPSVLEITPAIYGYQVLAGLGIGGTYGMAILYVGHVVERRDAATGSGALVEFRILGGALGLAIMAATIENYLKSHLGPLLPADTLNALLKTSTVIDTLPADVRIAVLTVYADAYILLWRITTGFSAAQFLAIAMIWKNPQIEVMGKEAPGMAAET